MITSWKTTLFGVLAACWGIGDGIIAQLAAGAAIDWKTVIGSLVVAGLGFFAKDHNASNATAPGPSQIVTKP